MTETARTAAFAAVAAVAVAFAAVLSWPGPTPETAGFEQVGTPFFTAFETNAADAAGNLSKIGRFTITAFDADTGAIQDFRIRRDDDTGLYGIAPYDYPAEAAEQLAEIASALGSVERTALQSRRASDWADLGVVDPASEDVAQLEGRGLRIEVLGDDGNTLADLIVGKAVEGRDGYFYVREPRDDSTYIAQLANLDLSASFVDWIDPKALEDVESSELRRITVPDETVDPQSGELVSGDPLVLSRDGSAGDWTAADPPAGKSVDQAKVNQIASAASGLMIVGVRPKPAGLKPDLTLDPAVVRSQAQYQAIVRDVTGKGFSILPTADGGGQVLGEAGQLTVSTAEGVAYDLDFGELFTGNSYDFAVGDAGEGYKTLQAKPDADAESAPEKEDEEDESRGRYLFVIARVDAAALGEPPVEPQAPAEASDTEEQPGDEPAEDAEEPEGDADGEAEAAQAQYEQDLAAYRTAKATYDRKLAAAAERVEELNRRYGDWYYVVDAADVAELSLRPAALLTDAPPALPTGGAAGEALPPGSSPIAAPGNLQDLINGLSPGMGGGSPASGSEPAADPTAEATGAEPAMTEETAESPNPSAPAEAAPAPQPKPTAPADAEPGNAAAGNADAARTPVTAPRPDRPAAPQPESSPPGEPNETPDPADGASETEQAGESGSTDDAENADSPADEGADGDE